MANSTSPNLLSNSSLDNSTSPPDYIYPFFVFVANKFYTINYVFLAPVICGIGFILNMIACGIFMTAEFKLKMYRLLFWTSFFHGVALLVQTLEPITQLDSTYASHFEAVYRMAIRTWIYNAFTMTALLCNVAVSFDRYIMVSKRCECFFSKIPVLVLVSVFFLISLACFCFPMFAYYIKLYISESGREYFWLYYTDFGYSDGFSDVRIVMYGFRDCILWFIFVVINVLLLFETRKHFRNKKRLRVGFENNNATTTQNNTAATLQTASRLNNRLTRKSLVAQTNATQVRGNLKRTDAEKAEIRITRMTIVTSVVLIFGQVSYFINILCTTITGFTNSSPTMYLNAVLRFINTIAILSNEVAYAALFFVFYFFDKNFKGFILKKISRAS
jgi:hypothetical protein